MRNSRIVPIALILIIIAVAIAALISLGRAVFFPDASSETVSQLDSSREALLNTTLEHSVTMTVRGPIVGDEQFRSYQVAISPNSRTLTTYTGYIDRAIDQISLANNTPAYEEFVYALNRANLVRGSELTGDKNDRRGVCSSGSVYEFAVLNAGKSVKTLWTTTCSSTKGSLNANVATLRLLFVDQIPKGQSLINKVDL